MGRKIPWGPILGGAAVGALGLGAGYIGGGLLANQLVTHFPENALVRGIQSMTPRQQKMLLGALASTAGAVGAGALLARSTAFGQHIQNASDELNRPTGSRGDNPKEAMVREAYAALGVL